MTLFMIMALVVGNAGYIFQYEYEFCKEKDFQLEQCEFQKAMHDIPERKVKYSFY